MNNIIAKYVYKLTRQCVQFANKKNRTIYTTVWIKRRKWGWSRVVPVRPFSSDEQDPRVVVAHLPHDVSMTGRRWTATPAADGGATKRLRSAVATEAAKVPLRRRLRQRPLHGRQPVLVTPTHRHQPAEDDRLQCRRMVSPSASITAVSSGRLPRGALGRWHLRQMVWKRSKEHTRLFVFWSPVKIKI